MTRRQYAGRVLVALYLLFNAWPTLAEEPTFKDLYTATKNSVVLVRSWQVTAIEADGVIALPDTELGSGVLISAGGEVLTAAHLVQIADSVSVEFLSGERIKAKVIASEPAADLALLRLDRVPDGATIANLGNSDDVRIGQQVFAIGAPYGLGHTMSVGRISGHHAPGATGGPFNLAEFFQADVAVHSGNSGGRLFDRNGEVIGMISHMLSRSGRFEGLGFAVTANAIKELLLNRRSPWTGISFYSLDPVLAAALNVPQKAGLIVQQVATDSPGARLGLIAGFLPAKIGRHELLLGGDIILAVDGIDVGMFDSYVALREHLADIEVGDKVTVKVMRHGSVHNLSITSEQAGLGRPRP